MEDVAEDIGVHIRNRPGSGMSTVVVLLLDEMKRRIEECLDTVGSLEEGGIDLGGFGLCDLESQCDGFGGVALLINGDRIVDCGGSWRHHVFRRFNREVLKGSLAFDVPGWHRGLWGQCD